MLYNKADERLFQKAAALLYDLYEAALRERGERPFAGGIKQSQCVPTQGAKNCGGGW